MWNVGNFKKNLFLMLSISLIVLVHAQETLSPSIVQEIQAGNTPVARAIKDSAEITNADSIDELEGMEQEEAKPIPAKQTPVKKPEPIKKNTKEQVTKKNIQKNLISFNYEAQDLITVINDIAAKKKVNFILPQGEDAKLLAAAKLTLSFDHEIPIDKAWQLLQTALDFAGFSIMPQGSMYVIKKTQDNTATEPAPLYIDVDPSELPDSQQRIRYIRYLANIKVTDENESELQTVIKTLLPEIPRNAFVIDKRTNSILVMAKSFEIKALMEIVSQLDKAGFQEKIAVVPLRHTSAGIVATLFQNNILKSNDQSVNRYHLDARKQTEATYFSQFARVVAEPRTNSLIVIGRNQAVDRIKDFLLEYIDVELGSGKSILHVYQLQYLNAADFEGVLTAIVAQEKAGGTGQSQAGAPVAGGTERYFDEVIIKTDTPPMSQDQIAAQAAGNQDVSLIPPARTSGTNSLVIAARNDDWLMIKKIIEQLDIPQPQVLLEVFIADLTDEDLRKLGATVRNPLKLPLFNEMNFQSAQLDPGIITDAGICNSGTISAPQAVSPVAGATPSTVGVITQGIETAAADILSPNKGLVACGDSTTPNTDNPLGLMTPGSTAISLSDNNGKTWGVAQILSVLNTNRIISHPHIISVSNKEALVQLGEQKLLPGGLAGSGGSTLAQKQEYVSALLTVKINPRINIDEDTVNLSIMVASNDFTTATVTNGNQNVRQVVTNASVKSKEMLAIGGLMRNTNDYNTSKTPLFGDVPVLGQLFRNRRQRRLDNNFTLFIVPTIIKPRLRAGIGDYTQKYVNIARSYATQGDLFDTLRDPISHWFFKTGANNAEHIISDFVDKDQVHTNVPYPDDRRKAFAQAQAQESEQLNTAVLDDIKNEKSPFKKEKRRAKAHLRA